MSEAGALATLFMEYDMVPSPMDLKFNVVCLTMAQKAHAPSFMAPIAVNSVTVIGYRYRQRLIWH